MLCTAQRHQPLNTSISLELAPFYPPPFFVPLSPKINAAPNLHPRADISIREINSGSNIQNEIKQICCQIRAAGCLSHVPKDESFNGLDPVKPRSKYKKAAYEEQRVIILGHEGEDAKKLHVRYGSEHALESVRIEKDQRSRDSVFSSNSKELASTAESNPNSSTLSSKELHKLTFSSSVPTSNTGPKKQNYEGPSSTPSYHSSLQPEKVAKITTLNSPLYNPGSVESPRSTPTESLSTTSSPVLEQAHPVLFPDSFNQVNQGERRSSVISIDSTVAPSSPQQTYKKRRRVHPSQGDSVLISFLGPDQPLVAIRAGESPLPWPSGSESAAETEMEGGSGGNDGAGGNSNHGSRSVSRQRSSEGLRGNQNGGSSDGNTTNGGAAAGGDGGDERKGNSGDGEKDKGSGDGEKDGEEKKKEKDNKKKTDKDKETLTLETDAMDIDESSKDKPTNGEHKSKSEQEDVVKDGTGKRDSNAMEVDVSSSETALHSSGATLPGSFSTAGATPWTHAQTSPGGTDRGPPPSPGPSNQLFQNNKLPLPNSPPSLPSMIPSMNAQSASSPNSLPSGNDGRHTTLPPVSSIHVLADIAEKESSHQQQSSRGYPNRMPPNSRTVYPTVSSHVSVAPSNRSAQAAQSPGLPPPGPAAHGFGPDGNPRPPMHHMSMQQRQYYMNQESSPTPYYPQHQHYQSYSQIKEGPQGSPNGNSGPYPPAFSQGRELPSIISSSPSAAANFFAQPHMPSTISGRRDSTMDAYYGSDQTPPSGPSTGETMPSSGTDDTVTSPRSRPGMPAGGQGGPLTAGVFKCEYPGCKAQPFQTQYLLNSHANVHSSARPHYCPVKNCARGEGGKGFKRKNEMIRHGLVHDSPGYVCPFCPDREHKYPRPDNLQRHVRVHHMDKDKDDPQLRDVLSQRPEGGNRGRRRRLGT